MDEQMIRRINALAHKAKTEGLTEEETRERDRLRQAYVAAVRASLVGQLEHTYLVDETGRKTKLKRKKGGVQE